MLTNINRITEFPGDRVLLIVGSGDVAILGVLARDAAYFCLEDAAAYLN